MAKRSKVSLLAEALGESNFLVTSNDDFAKALITSVYERIQRFQGQAVGGFL